MNEALQLIFILFHFYYLNYSRKNPFGLLIAPNKTNEAFGYLFWDDGDSLSK